MSYIDNIRIFVRAVEVGNISAAGRDLRVSPAVASNRIKELETHLGIRLFNRTTRQLNLTEQGSLYYEGAVKILEMISETEAAVADMSQNPKGHLVVSAPTAFGIEILAPLIPEFHSKFPDIQIRLRLTDKRVDLIKKNIDLAFHMGELPDSNLKLLKVANLERILLASPEYIAKRGMPKDLMDLKHNHNCLLLRFPGSREYYWSFRNGQETTRLDVSGSYDSDNSAVLMQWALSGHGIINRPIYEVYEIMEQGRLQAILPNVEVVSSDLNVVYAQKRHQEPKIRVFLDHIVPMARLRLSERRKINSATSHQAKTE